jgi:hypothetical protein
MVDFDRMLSSSFLRAVIDWGVVVGDRLFGDREECEVDELFWRWRLW